MNGIRSFALMLFFCQLFVWNIQDVQCQDHPRETMEFGRSWKFMGSELSPAEVLVCDTGWKEVDIPHTWNNRDIQSGGKVLYGTAWYKKDLPPMAQTAGKQFFLKFSGVGQYAGVYLNDRFVGEHLGAYSAFTLNITRFIRTDTINTIFVMVNNELTQSYPKDNFLFGIFGGIYRDVSLIITGDLHVGLTDHASSGIYINQEEVSERNAVLRVVTMLKNDGPSRQNFTLQINLMTQEGAIYAHEQKEVELFPGGLVPVTTLLNVEAPRLWNGRKDPYLYTLETTLLIDGQIMDRVTDKTGIRHFSIDPERGFILNGNPYRLYGVCRHQEWQDLGNALHPAHHLRDMELIDEIGATSIRLAHYQQADYMYSLADSLGILVWAEIPFVNGYLDGADGNAVQQMTELVKQNFNHPSIFVWGVHNEVIKGDAVQGPVNLTRSLHNLAKSLDPGRPTVSVSNIWWIYDHPIHGLTDLQGFNQYSGWYGGKPEDLANWIRKYHETKPDVRFSVSEYGAGANTLHQSEDDTTPPGPLGQFFPEGYQTRYHEVTWQAIEQAPFIWASYVWNMFDFSVPEWDRGGIKGRNHKGLVTYDRKIKKDAFYWYKANWSDEPVLYLAGRRNIDRRADTCLVKAYCNFGTPELRIDGRSMGKMDQGINPVHFVLQVELDEGEHQLEIMAEKDGQVLRDTIEVSIHSF